MTPPRPAIPGADELVGRGVYRGLPDHLPPPVRDGHAVVAGEPAACAAAARKLGDAGWDVTVVTVEARCGCGMRRDCRRRVGAEVVCATGIEYLEALVVRRLATGRIHACNASALFLV